MARQNVMTARATACTAGCGVVLRAARNASGTDAIAARVVPSTAINRVSTASMPMRAGSSSRGGIMRCSSATMLSLPSISAVGTKSIAHAETMVASTAAIATRCRRPGREGFRDSEGRDGGAGGRVISVVIRDAQG